MVMVEEEGEAEEGEAVHTKSMENVCRALKLNNFADIGATDFIFASIYS